MRGVRDEKARGTVLEALAAGLGPSEAARRAGIGRRTVYTWAERGDDELRQALEAAAARGGRGRRRRPAVGEPGAAPEDQADLELALGVLRAIAEDPDQPGAARVAAARALIAASGAPATSAGAPPLAPVAPAAPEPAPPPPTAAEAAARWRGWRVAGGSRPTCTPPKSG
jgi:hypothetical protein